VEIELSVTFAPELGEAVRAAGAEAGLSLDDWMAQAAEAKIRADGQARILEEAEQERRFQALREALDEYHAECGPCTGGQMAEASRMLRGVEVEPITREDGFRAGELLGATRVKDAIDASVALLAGPGDRVLTSDAGDLRALCAGAGNKAVVIDC
jgi:hypothetical protein